MCLHVLLEPVCSQAFTSPTLAFPECEEQTLLGFFRFFLNNYRLLKDEEGLTRKTIKGRTCLW